MSIAAAQRTFLQLLGMTTPLGLTALVAVLPLSAHRVCAQPSGYEDFGAETVIGDPTLLPLNEVEETEVDEEASEGSAQQLAVAPQAGSESEAAIDVQKALSEVQLLNLRGKAADAETEAGVEIASLGQSTELFELGLRPADVVRSINGVSVASPQQLKEILRQAIELRTSVVVLERNGEEVVVPMVFGANGAVDGTGDAVDEETTTILNVTDVDIAALVKTFSKLTKRNYIVDSSVKGTVTIHLPTPVSIPESLRILDTVLLLKGFTTVPVAENTWKVVSAKDAKQTTIPLITEFEGTPSDVMVTKMLRLKHIAASDMQQLLSQFVSKEGGVNAFEGTNSLIIIDSAQNIVRLQELVAELDVPAVDQEMSIIPILHADAEDVAEKINEILGEEEEEQNALSIAARTSSLRPASIARSVNSQAAAAGDNAGSSIRARTLGFKIIPDERTNSIIVVADEEMTLRIKVLVEQLDSEVDRSGGRFYVYRLEHADSEELAEILNQLLNGTGGGAASDDSGTQGSSLSSRRSPAQTPDSNASTGRQARLTRALQRSRELLRQRLGGGTGEAPEGRVNLEGEVSIAPDPATNSLVINASRADYSKIKDVIALLDVKRRQVIVEATILEITLTNQEGMGIELQGTAAFEEGGGFAQTNYGGLTNLLTQPQGLTDLTIAAASSGTLTLPGGITIPSQAVLLQAVSRLSNVNVLSAPTIMATDNQEAEIIVGQNVPFVTSTSTDTSNINNTFNTIERQDVGITLRITPQISSGDFVVLSIFVEISNVVAGTANDPNGPTTTIRTTETAVTVKDGQMVVTGGLIQDSTTDSTRGVPYLQDIPVLGHLFKRQDTTIDKTNLLILITPRVIKDQFDARLATRESHHPLKQHIERYDLSPDREEIFNDSSVDRVVESYPIDPGQLPTTITAPRTRTVERDGVAIRIAPPTGDAIGDEVMELSVAPVLPGLQAEGPRATLQVAPSQGTSNRAAQQPSRLTQSALGTSGIAILRPLVNGAPKLLALTLPNAVAQEHFQVGSVYANNSSAKATNFVCIGRYASLAEAEQMHDTLSEILEMSPAEMLGLGTDAWVPASAEPQ